MVTPFGGPASGLWPSGSGVAAAPAEEVGVTPGPPGPTCFTPTNFADCLASCVGTITVPSPGPVCGWVLATLPGIVGGSIVFTPGSMSFNTTTAAQYPSDMKTLDAPLASLFGVSGQFSFTEFTTVPNPDTAYNLFVTNSADTQVLQVFLLGDGNVGFAVGPPAGADLYLGTWTPNNGTHEVHFSTDALGVPTLYIDDVLIPLAFLANVPNFGGSLPADTVAFQIGSGSPIATSAVVTNLFVTNTITGPETEFCCPT